MPTGQMRFAKPICKKRKFVLFDGENKPVLCVPDTLIDCLYAHGRAQKRCQSIAIFLFLNH
jgi:hypothetical protein